MATIKEQILGTLKSREERLKNYLSEEIVYDDTILERTAAEGIGQGGAFDYHTLAKQYVESTLKELLKGKGSDEVNAAFSKAVNSIVFGVKSTFVGNKKLTNKTLLDAAKKDPRVAKLLRLDNPAARKLTSRLDKNGVTETDNVELAMKGPVLTQRYAMFSDAVRAIAKDKNWIQTFKNTLVASSAKGAEYEGTKAFAPTGKEPKLKRKFSVDDKTEGDQGGIGKKKYSVDDKTEGDQGGIGKHLKEEVGSEGDGGEAFSSKKKASCNTCEKKKASVDTDEEDSPEKKAKKEKKEKQEKAWNGIKQYKNFNY